LNGSKELANNFEFTMESGSNWAKVHLKLNLTCDIVQILAEMTTSRLFLFNRDDKIIIFKIIESESAYKMHQELNDMENSAIKM
jgi:hypothetical protein